jgi:hypothetical protein
MYIPGQPLTSEFQENETMRDCASFWSFDSRFTGNLYNYGPNSFYLAPAVVSVARKGRRWGSKKKLSLPKLTEVLSCKVGIHPNLQSLCSLQYTLLLLAWTFFFCRHNSFLFLVIPFISLSTDHGSCLLIFILMFSVYVVGWVATAFWHGWQEDMSIMGKLRDKLFRSLFPGWWNMLGCIVCKQ